MKLIGLMPVRNEAWILGLSARVALRWVDEMVFLDHASTDETGAILEDLACEFPGRVTVERQDGDIWREMDHRQRTLDIGRQRGGTHFAIVDADEILTANALQYVRAYMASLAPGQYLATNMYAMWRTHLAFRHDGSVWSNRRDLVLGFADRTDLCWKARSGYDHHQRAPIGSYPGKVFTQGGVMHMQFASWRRLVAKHCYYRVIEREKYPDKPVSEIEHTYSQATNELGLSCKLAPATWWSGYEDLLGYYDPDYEPWHEEYCRQRIAERGVDYFAGLNLSHVLATA